LDHDFWNRSNHSAVSRRPRFHEPVRSDPGGQCNPTTGQSEPISGTFNR